MKPTGQRWTLDTDYKIAAFMDEIRRRRMAGEPLTVAFMKPSRSNEQNNMLHELIREIAAQKGDESPIEIKRYIKLHLGVPILRADDQEFREKYDDVVKPLHYEKKLEIMDLLPVTSRMDKSQFSVLIDSIIKHYHEQGIEFASDMR